MIGNKNESEASKLSVAWLETLFGLNFDLVLNAVHAMPYAEGWADDSPFLFLIEI